MVIPCAIIVYAVLYNSAVDADSVYAATRGVNHCPFPQLTLVVTRCDAAALLRGVEVTAAFLALCGTCMGVAPLLSFFYARQFGYESSCSLCHSRYRFRLKASGLQMVPLWSVTVMAFIL